MRVDRNVIALAT